MTSPTACTSLAAALLCAVLAPAPCAADAPALPRFSAEEIRAIVSMARGRNRSRDATNRVSGNHEAVVFGTQMFFDNRMSAKGTVSCGTCHVPERNWTDNRERGAALGVVERNTPTLMNARLSHWFGWGGSSDSLWSHSIRPILEPRELGASARHVAELVRHDAELACRYRKAFGAAPSATDDEAVLVDVAKALAAFQETLQSGRTPFDAFRDALARGEQLPEWRYSAAAQRGLQIFVGRGGCTGCHSGANFSNGEFHDNGLSAYAERGRADRGRADGVGHLRAGRYTLKSAYNDDASGASARKLDALPEVATAQGRFKVPSLRNLLLTAPYGHHGRVATLADMVGHYSEFDFPRAGAEPTLKPLRLTARERTDLVVFLESLSTFTNPWRPEESGGCH